MGFLTNGFGWPHMIILLVIILLLFGAPKLPALARSLGQSMKIFRSEIKSPVVDEDAKAEAVDADVAPSNGVKSKKKP
jgi:sec-independent protein translocase protein TatA